MGEKKKKKVKRSRDRPKRNGQRPMNKAQKEEYLKELEYLKTLEANKHNE